MVKHNNEVPNQHFHKHWQRWVRTWLNQPGRKKSRRNARNAKAAAVAPRPSAGALRPVVRCPTNKYNTKVRAGKGFTLAEVKAAGFNGRRGERAARALGIAVDHRRSNKSADSLRINAQRLKEYRTNLIVFPRRRKAKAYVMRKGDSSEADLANATQNTSNINAVAQIVTRSKARKISNDDKSRQVYATLRKARADARNVGKKKDEE